MVYLQKKKDYQIYKGFMLSLNKKEYTASAYANPVFVGNNLAKIKRAINQYLRDEKYRDTNEIYHIK